MFVFTLIIFANKLSSSLFKPFNESMVMIFPIKNVTEMNSAGVNDGRKNE